MLDRYFLDHPRTVDESYGTHFVAASGFGMAMILGGLACLLHAVIPALCEKTGSTIIRRLHDRMVVNRRRSGAFSTEHQALGAD